MASRSPLVHSTLWLLLAIGLGVGGWILGLNLFRSPAPPASHEGARRDLPEPRLSQTNAAQSEAPESLPPPPSDALLDPEDPNALPGQTVVFIGDDAARRALADALREAGFAVRSLDALDALWIDATRGRLRGLLGDEVKMDGNFPVSLPALPDPASREATGLVPFDNNVLSILGVPGDNQAWGEGVRVAVLDTGVGFHQSLQNARIQRFDLLGGELGDPNGHGTAVAYQLVADDAFASGVVPAAEVLSYRVLGADGRGDAFTLAEGIVEAVDNGAQVINMSLGTVSNSAILESAVAYAHERGVILVAPSGNAGTNQLNYPAAYPEVLSVSAVDAVGTIAPFANEGAVDVAAPGYGLPAAWQLDEYIYFDGTSGAATYVTAAAAQLLSTNPELTPTEARELIQANANEIGAPGFDTRTGAGSLDLDRLMNREVAGRVDLAVADLYFEAEAANPQTLPATLTIQNQGTSALPASNLTVMVGDQAFTYPVPTTQAGEMHAVQLLLPTSQVQQSGGVQVWAEVTLPPHWSDLDESNNELTERVALLEISPPNGG